jgi:hypothetical protein
VNYDIIRSHVKGEELSDKSCYDLNDDNSNCGSIGNACGEVNHGISSCKNGECVVSCQEDYHLEDGKCVMWVNDTNRCGIHGLQCISPQNGIPICNDNMCSYQCMSGE